MRTFFKCVAKLACTFCVLFTLNNSTAAELEDFAAKLNRADEIRSSDKEEFSKILSELRPNFDNLSIQQKYLLVYLTGYEHAYQGKIDKAVSSYSHVYENVQDITLKYRAALSLVNLYAISRDWTSGFQYLDFISNQSEQIDSKEFRHLGLMAANMLYSELEQFELTLVNTKILKNEDVTGRNLCFALGLELKALLNIKPEQIQSGQFQEAIKTCLSLDEKVVANVVRTNFAQYLINNKEFEKAASLLSSNLEEILNTNYTLLIVDAHSLLAKANFELGNYNRAGEHARKVTINNKDVRYIKPLVDSYFILYQIAFSEKDHESAVIHLLDFIEAEKIQYEDIKAKQLSIELAKFQSIQKDSEISLLNKQNQILKLEKELSDETALYNRWIIGLLAILVTILIAWTVNVRRSQQKLKYLAEYDGLTGVCNRSHFTRSSEDLLNVLSKSNRAASLVLFDLDNFKRVNDNYGHPVGDEVLKLAAGVCRDSVRRVDVFGRVGGEEFAILLPGCDLEQASKIAEDCREKMCEIDTSETGHKFDISGSFGIANTESSGYQLKDLMAHADEAMYLAKRRGRNQVVVQSTE